MVRPGRQAERVMLKRGNMDFWLLGSVEVRAGGRPVDIGGPRQRTVLAALAADAGRSVPVDVLIDRVWGQVPPERARHTLQIYVTRLRDALRGGGVVNPIVRRSGGYALDVDPETVDLHRFLRAVEKARQEGSDLVRVTLLRQALGLWRGRPLADVSGEWAIRAREGWHQQRLEAAGMWASAELNVGNPAAVIGALTELLGENELVEPLVALLMRALHLTGRTADALDRYTLTRQRLAEQLGVDPGRELQDLHLAILRGDLDVAVATPTSVRPLTESYVPAQLPLDVHGFVGREAELKLLDHVLAKAAADQPTSVVVSAVWGTAGVGKSALVVHWAHRVAECFPDGQLYVNLRGFDPSGSTMGYDEAVRRFLDGLEVPPERIPADIDAQVDLYRSLLAGRRMLVVLDNARDAEQIRPLLPGSPGCLVVVTSRNQLTGLVAAEGALPLPLDLLPSAEARALLARRIGELRMETEPDAVDDIVVSCAGLPLALAVAAASAACSPSLPLSSLAAELRGARSRLEALTGDDPATDVRAVFSWSYDALSNDSARMFRLLGVHPGPDISYSAAASLAGLPVRRARLLLADLVRANLVVEHVPGRYTFHDLLRAYAAEQARLIEPENERHAATHRMLDHYVQTADAAATLLNRHRPTVALPPPHSDVLVEELSNAEGALDWFSNECAVLLNAIGLAAGTGFDTYALNLSHSLITFLGRRGQWHDLGAALESGLRSARRLSDREGESRAHLNLAWVNIQLSRYDSAVPHLMSALDLRIALDDVAGQARVLGNLAMVSERTGRYAEALSYSRSALGLFQATDDLDGQARALNEIGWSHAQLGDYSEALEYCQRSLAMHREIGDSDGEAMAWDTLGFTHYRMGDHLQATTCYERALGLCREIGVRGDEAEILDHIGDANHAAGDVDTARQAWRSALDLMTEIDHPSAGTVRLKLGERG